MFFSRNKKNNVYPCKPQFYYIKVGFQGVKIIRRVFVMDSFDEKSDTGVPDKYKHLKCVG